MLPNTLEAKNVRYVWTTLLGSIILCSAAKDAKVSFNKSEKTKFQLAFQDSSVARCRKEPSIPVTKKVDAGSTE